MHPTERDPVSVDRLMALDPFADLDHHDLTMLARWVREIRVPAGSALVEQGDLPYDLFVIENGTVEIVRDDEVLATLGPGQLVGEMAVLRGERRMATVRAADDVTAVAVAATDLAAMTEEMPEVVRAMHALTQARAASNDDA
jgi:CRP-like cAMP-binding protein